jgi:hypothetical protein
MASHKGTRSGPEHSQACRACAHFHNDPRYLEAAFPGWTALGSAYGSTRAEDGICELRGLFLSAEQWCEQFAEKTPPRAPPLRR